MEENDTSSPPPPSPTITPPGRTLLPTPLAQAVSLATRSTSLAIRLGATITSYGFGAAKSTTLSSLDLGRGIVEGILSRAGSDVLLRSRTDLARQDAESVLEKSLESLHHAMTHVLFWTAASFHATSASFSTARDLSQLLLSSLDQFFGSTDSSRAIASIIALIRREFANPATGAPGERVGVVDLVLAMCSLAYLQARCWNLREEEDRRRAIEHVVWDVVVLEDGVRVDVVGAQEAAPAQDRGSCQGRESLGAADVDEERLKEHLRATMPDGAAVSISTSTTTTKTITVDFGGPRPSEVPAPPGLRLVEDTNVDPDTPRRHARGSAAAKACRLVHNVDRVKTASATYHTSAGPQRPDKLRELASDSNHRDRARPSRLEPPPPPVPPKDPPTNSLATDQASGSGNPRPRPEKDVGSSGSTSSSRKSPSGTADSQNTPSPSPVRQGQQANEANQKKQRASLPRPPLDLSPPRASPFRDPPPLSRPSRKPRKPPESKSSGEKTSSRRIPGKDGASSSSSSSLWHKNPGNKQQKSLRALGPSPMEPSSPAAGRRPRSCVLTPSLCSIATNDSQTSLVLSSYYHRSAYSDEEAINVLRREGTVEGIFPRGSLLHNVTRYMLFSSASYGYSFLKVMGISQGPAPSHPRELPHGHLLSHHDVQSFVHHTSSRNDSILLTSFADPNGGSDATGSTKTGIPLVHYISLDHEAKAVVLACRGTLGFEDILADMTCEYDELVWRGKSFHVHKGVHASARRILYGGDGRVLVTLREALEEFDGYGLVLCGHSLGGAVTSVLGIMLAEPNWTGKGFVTSSTPHRAPGARAATEAAHIELPPGRPIHVYAYGPPGTVSTSLRRATRGLISSVVHGNDLVPYLSLGVLRDLQAAALTLKKGGGDGGVSRDEVRRRVWNAFQTGLAEKWNQNASARVNEQEAEGRWARVALDGLRDNMGAKRLLPPGDVFVVEATRVLRRDAFAQGGATREGSQENRAAAAATSGLGRESGLGRPARRIVMKYVRDVEKRFGEVRFGARMLIDHSPGAYEEVLGLLRRGVDR